MDELFTIVERAKKEWESAVDSISEGVALYEPASFSVRRANWTLARWLNTTPHKMVGVNLHSLLCGCERSDCELLLFLRSPSSMSLEIERQQTAQKWLLSIYPVSNSAQPSPNTVIVLRDVTQERLMQQRVIDAEKRAAMMRTAAGLAHQIMPYIGYIQQNLSIINSNLSEVRNALIDYRIALRAAVKAPPQGKPPEWENIEARHRVEFMLADIEQALKQGMYDLMRIYKSVDDIGDLQGPAAKMQYNDLNLILENAINFVWSDLRNKVAIERRYQKDIPLVRCNQIRMQTALMSLMIYCTQYIHLNGQITLTTKRLDGRAEITIEARNRSTEGDVSPDITGEPDAKAGLVVSIIEEHEGELIIETKPDGAVFAQVRLPVDGPASSSSP
jgi:nitrogen-specific signal transduction histidine kinase